MSMRAYEYAQVAQMVQADCVHTSLHIVVVVIVLLVITEHIIIIMMHTIKVIKQLQHAGLNMHLY